MAATVPSDCAFSFPLRMEEKKMLQEAKQSFLDVGGAFKNQRGLSFSPVRIHAVSGPKDWQSGNHRGKQGYLFRVLMWHSVDVGLRVASTAGKEKRFCFSFFGAVSCFPSDFLFTNDSCF